VTFLNCPWHVAWVSCIAKLPGSTAFVAPHCTLGMFLYSVAWSTPSETPSYSPNTWACLHLKLQACAHLPVARFYSGSQRNSLVLRRLFPRPCLWVIQDELLDFLTLTATGPRSSSCVTLIRGWFSVKVGNQAPQFQQSPTWRLIIDTAATSHLSRSPLVPG